MTSQLNVDTIVDKAGSGGTNVKVGNTSTYVSDGGAVTQNTVQSLCKVWGNLNGTSTISLDDSFNVGSVTDNGTGDYRFTYSNAFSTNNNSAQGTSYAVHTQNYDNNSAYAELRTYGSATSAYDPAIVNIAVFGDLA